MNGLVDKLQGVLPTDIYAELIGISNKRNINAVQLSHLLGNAEHECAKWTKFIENLNYSAQGLANTWPSRYAIDPKAKVKSPNALAKKIERNPEAIANNVYANRMGNGSPQSGDGWKHRGRGAIMTTGKNNYALFDATVVDDIMQNLDLVATKYKLTTAFWFFDVNRLWTLCIDCSDNSIIKVGTKINGGQIGMSERIKLVKKYFNILSK